MASPNLGIVHLASLSEQPEVVVNAAIDKLDRSENDSITYTVAGNVIVTSSEATENFMHILDGTPGAGFDWTMPNAKRKFAVQNDSGQTATIKAAGGGLTVALLTGKVQHFWTDGSDIKALAAAV